MTKTLEQQIADRKQQAERRHIYHKAAVVKEKLAEVGRDFNDAASHLTIYHAAMPGFGGERPDEEWLTISYKGKKVYQESSVWDDNIAGQKTGIDFYIPGEWEQKLNALYKKAQHVDQTKEAAAAKQKQAAEKIQRAKWGL